MRRLTASLGIWGLVLAAGACGESTAEDVRLRTEPIVTKVVSEVERAVDSAGDMSEIKQVLDGIDVVVPGLITVDDTVKADAAGSTSNEDVAAQVNEALAKYVFTEDNVESSGGDSVTFLLKGAVVCAGVTETRCAAPVGGDATCDTQPAGQDCEQMVDKLKVRIKARLVGSDGVDLSFSVGGRATVITLVLRPDEVTVDLSLDGAADTVKYIADITGEQIDLPQVMSGVTSASLLINGPQDLTLKSAVKQAVRIQAQGTDGAYKLDVEARDPLVALNFKGGAAPSVSLDLDWGAVSLLMPAREAWEQASGNLELLIKGLSATLKSDGQGGLAVTGMGLGDGKSHVSLDGKPLVELELNAASGHQMDLQITPWQSDLPSCKVTPGMDLQLTLALGPIESYLDEPLEAWQRDETYSIKLSGSGSATVAPVAESATFPGGLNILDGELTLQTTKQPATVQVSAGSCLVYREDVPAGEHPALGHWTSVPCP